MFLVVVINVCVVFVSVSSVCGPMSVFYQTAVLDVQDFPFVAVGCCPVQEALPDMMQKGDNNKRKNSFSFIKRKAINVVHVICNHQNF